MYTRIIFTTSQEKINKILENTNFTNVSEVISKNTKDIHKNTIDKIKSDCAQYNLKLFSTREFEDKIDHGDIDLYYSDDIDVKSIIIELFDPIVIKKWTKLLFSYKFSESQYFQIDFIQVTNINLSDFFFLIW